MFGTTESGRDWCIKALHPSDPITEVRGIPDESAVPSLFMNYQTVASVSASEGATGTWSVDGQLLPNPVQFAAMMIDDDVGGVHPFVVANSQISEGSTTERTASFINSFTRWRLAYASVTIYQDGPDLANQGTVAVCQKPVIPPKYNVSLDDQGESTFPKAVGLKRAFHLSDSDLPNYEASQAMPNAYFGKSKEGAYIPLKLTRTHQQWHSVDDLMYQATSSTLSYMSNTTFGMLTGGQLTIPSSTERDGGYGQYPFIGANDLHVTFDGETSFGLNGSLVPDFCNDTWADFSFRNLAVTTSLSFFFRFGFEVQCQPRSLMSPHLKLSPHYDPQAIETYFAISRELKDAYPADYNDAGKIWSVISNIAKSVAPFLGAIPGIGGILSTGIPMLARGGDAIAAAIQRAKGNSLGSTLSQGDIEAIRATRVPMTPPKVTQEDLNRARRALTKRVMARKH